MLQENMNALQKLIGRFSTDSDGLATARAKEKEAEEAFMSKFEDLEHNLIWPVIVDIGNQLNAYGHDYHVEEQEEFVDATAHFEPAKITFNIYPAGLDKKFCTPDSTPYISFVANRYAQKVGIVVSTMMPNEGGVVGCHCEFGLPDITVDFVEKAIIDVLEKALILR